MSLIQNRLDNISVQMGGVMLRTARSPIFSQSHDFSCFLTDAAGVLVSQADGIPIHSGGGGVSVRAMLDAFAEDMAAGDVYLSNDPYVAGGNHLPDWVLARPVFVSNQLVAFACIRAHQADIGGGVAGTYNPHATEIFHEGVRLPPLKLVERGVMREDLWALLMLNTRCPDEVDGDLRAMLGSTQIGAEKLSELGVGLGATLMQRYLSALLDHSERALGTLLERLPNGVYRAEERLLNDCFEDREIRIQIALQIQEGFLTVDFAGTDSQIKGFKNSSLSNTHSAVYAAVASFFDASLPRNEGAFRRVRVSAPRGSLVNPNPPAPMTLCTATPAHEIMHAVWWALSQADPARGLAGWGKNCFPITSGRHDDGRVWAMYHWGSSSGTGATRERDGFAQLGGLGTLGGLMLPNAEASEQTYPVRVLRQEFRRDGGGAGARRGGTGVIYEAEIDAPAEYVLRGEGVGPPSGLGILGARAGAGGAIRVIDAAGGSVRVPVFGTMQMGPSLLRVESAGGGGYGDPFEREISLVVRDVLDEVVSTEVARKEYGVAVDADGNVDQEETASLRRKVERNSRTRGLRSGDSGPAGTQ
ncbi:MAG: hydantoinase B/oxoprolinase family protein [Burkholderiaceae bacterium]|nr:hydantoinase B/oxoprolinase family protein [Burkholderiaceae bacterium]